MNLIKFAKFHLKVLTELKIPRFIIKRIYKISNILKNIDTPLFLLSRIALLISLIDNGSCPIVSSSRKRVSGLFTWIFQP